LTIIIFTDSFALLKYVSVYSESFVSSDTEPSITIFLFSASNAIFVNAVTGGILSASSFSTVILKLTSAVNPASSSAVIL
jgi:hypothetical protein